MKPIIPWLLLALITLAACGAAGAPAAGSVLSQRGTPSSVPSAAASDMAEIPRGVVAGDGQMALLQVSGGLTGKTETIRVGMDGSVTSGTQSRDASAEAAQKLAAALDATGIFDVKPGEYLPSSQCCDRFTYELTLVKNGTQYRYVTMDGATGAPPALMEAVSLVRQFARAGQ